MAISTAMCTSFKSELMRKQHDLGNAASSPIGGDTIKLVLIKATPAGTYGAASTNYSEITGNSDEATDSASPQGYTAGGGTLTNFGVTESGTTVFDDFDNITFSSVNLSADGCMLVNSSLSGAALSTHDFGATKTASGGDFAITFPTADSSNAIHRLA